MGKCDKFKCFKGYHASGTLTFSDSVNSFTLSYRLRSYCNGIVLFNWGSATITLTAAASPGVFTATSSPITKNFNSDLGLSDFRDTALFSVTTSTPYTGDIVGEISFNGTTPVFRVLGLEPAGTTLTASTTFTVYGGSTQWAQHK